MLISIAGPAAIRRQRKDEHEFRDRIDYRETGWLLGKRAE